MKKLFIFSILLLLAATAFSQAQTQRHTPLRDRANARLQATEPTSQHFDEAIAAMEGRLSDNQNGREYNRIAGKLHSLELNLYFLRNAFNDATTAQDRERILNNYKQKKTEYDSTRQELQTFIGTLRQ
jgi:TATA-binding protein-associated factor Taf7